MKKNKVPLVVAYHIMDKVYTPIIKFYTEMAKNGCFNYCSTTKRYITCSISACDNCDIDFFDNRDYSFTLNGVSKDIKWIHDKFIDKTGNVLFGALGHLFRRILNDLPTEDIR